MKYKHILLFALVASIAAAFLLLTAPASNAAQSAALAVEVSDLAVAGKEFSLAVSISDNPGFSKGILSLTYNKSYLSVVNVTAGSVLDDSNVTVTFKDNGNGTCAANVDVPYDISGDGILLGVRFKLSSSVKLNTSYPVKISGELINSNAKIITVNGTQGGFLLSCAHDYSMTVEKPTCKAEGFTLYKCNECQKTYQDDYTAKLPHTWKTIRTKKATCTENGTLEHTCTVCGYNETVLNGTALGHDYKKTVHAPSCLEEGYTVLTCSRCNSTEWVDYTPKIDHVLVQRVRLEPTCIETGLAENYCEMCGNVFSTEDIPKTAHNYVVKDVKEPTHTTKGFTSYQCSYCKAIFKDNYTDIKPYDVVYTVEVEATCDHTGLIVGVCSDGCGYKISDVVPMLAHTYGEWEVVTPADKGVEGLERHVCSACGYTESMVIPALPEDPPEDPVIRDFKISGTTVGVIASAGVLVLMIVVFLVVVFKVMRRKAPVK